MWVACLKIVDEILQKEEDIIYRMGKITKYIDLFRELPKLIQRRYTPKQVSFTFKYLDKDILVDDWTKYILNRDLIVVRIQKVPIIYTLVNSYTMRTLYHSTKLKDLYIQAQKIRCKDPLLVKKDGHLLDVLDFHENYLNSCIDRLIHKYNF